MITKSEFITFYNESHVVFKNYLFSLIRNKEIAEDFSQESYLKFLKHLPGNIDKKAWKTYLYTIGRRLVYDHLKRKKLWLKYELAELKMNVDNFYEIEDGLSVKTQVDQLLKIIKPKERELIYLAYIEERSHQEIAEITGLKRNSIKILLQRYRKKISTVYKKGNKNE